MLLPEVLGVLLIQSPVSFSVNTGTVQILGYGTMMAVVYLIIIIILMTFLLKLLNRWMQKVT
ncbi:MAG: hypothetical protein Ct9H300mP28_15990 [Pseudomonadota bacterium]|nr:MAG: hypothetical protein Ct9H300mP28_15990 [Pseudomonadota bacterium]